MLPNLRKQPNLQRKCKNANNNNMHFFKSHLKSIACSLKLEKDRRWVNRRRAEGRRPGSPPAEAEVEVRRSKVEAEGCQSKPKLAEVNQRYPKLTKVNQNSKF